MIVRSPARYARRRRIRFVYSLANVILRSGNLTPPPPPCCLYAGRMSDFARFRGRTSQPPISGPRTRRGNKTKKPTEKPRERARRVRIEYSCMTRTKALVVGRENAIETSSIRFDKKFRDTAGIKRFLI